MNQHLFAKKTLQGKMALVSLLIPILAIFCLWYELAGMLSLQARAFLLGCIGVVAGFAANRCLAGARKGVAGKLLLAAGFVLNSLLILFALYSAPRGWEITARVQDSAVQERVCANLDSGEIRLF